MALIFFFLFCKSKTLHNLIHPVRYWLADTIVSLDGYYNQTNESMERRAFTPCLVLGLSSTVEQTQRLTFLAQYCERFIFNSDRVLPPERSRWWRVQEKLALCNELQNEITVSWVCCTAQRHTGRFGRCIQLNEFSNYYNVAWLLELVHHLLWALFFEW